MKTRIDKGSEIMDMDGQMGKLGLVEVWDCEGSKIYHNYDVGEFSFIKSFIWSLMQ